MIQTFTIRPEDEPARLLSSKDARMGALIEKIGPVTYTVNGHYFERLAMSIIGQQLSPKAASTIAGRVRDLCPDFTPGALAGIPDESLRAAGLSGAKLNYIRGLSANVAEGRLPFHLFQEMSNEEVVQALTSVKGIGKWTAEMFLIFSLGRTDVLSLGDAGLQKAANWLYANYRSEGSALELYGCEWAPYQSIASLYLWQAIDTGLIHTNLP